jgi:hypothetical protein
MKTLPNPYPNQTAERILAQMIPRRQIISDADLRLTTRLLNQQRRIEELKRICGIK